MKTLMTSRRERARRSCLSRAARSSISPPIWHRRFQFIDRTARTGRRPQVAPCATASHLAPRPPIREQALLRQEAALVVHLARIPHPIAEVDVGEPHAARARNAVAEHEGTDRAAAVVRLVDTITDRQTV